MKRRFSVIPTMFAGLSLTVACGGSITGDSVRHVVTVRNYSPDPVTVKIGPADYGTVVPQDTTDFKEVNNGDNTVLVNGLESSLSPLNLDETLSQVGETPRATTSWAVIFMEDGREQLALITPLK